MLLHELLHEDQILLRDTVRGALENTLTSEYRTTHAQSIITPDPQIAELLESLALDEGFIGSDAPYSLTELGIVAVEFGRTLLPLPVLEHLSCAAALNNSSLIEDDSTQKAAALLGKRVTVAPPSTCCIALKKEGGSCAISGTITALPTLEVPTSVIVWDTSAASPKGYLVVRDVLSPLVTSERVTSLDLLMPLEKLTLSGVPAVPLGDKGSEFLLAVLRVMIANECAGISQYVLEKTCAYVSTREQYGVPIGGFQALQHSIANAYVEAESLRALARFAAWSLSASLDQVPLTSKTAIARAVSVTPSVCERAIQAHGGIGFTWEFELHHYLRRAKARAIIWGAGVGEGGTVSLMEEVLRIA